MCSALATLAAAAVPVATSAPADAATNTYYVDCAAISAGAGTVHAPWNSLAAVNAQPLTAGAHILLARGTTCSGNLVPQGSGTAGHPIVLGAYGVGARPVINAASTAAAALQLTDQSYWTIQDLEIVGGTTYGVYVTGNTAGGALTGITLQNLDVHGATGSSTVRGDSGEVYIYPRGSNETISNVKIDGVTAHDSEVGEGIFLAGAFGAFPPGTAVPTPGNMPLGSNNQIVNSTSYNVRGDAILLTTTTNGLLQNNVAHDSGYCGGSNCGSSTASGLWEWYCQDCTVQSNESYDNHTWSTTDGGAFDIDNFNANNLVQYNYGHDNAGYCITVFNGNGYKSPNNVFRYNVCANNRTQSSTKFADVEIHTNGTQNFQVYGNTIIANSAPSQPVIRVNSQMTGFFKNNIIYSSNPNLLSSSTPGYVTDNNDYWVTGGAAPTFALNGTSYSSLSAYTAGTGMESHSIYADPLLNDPAYHGVGRSATADKLQRNSPAFDKGVDVCAGIPGCDMGTKDFFGDPIPTGTVHTIGAFDRVNHASAAPQHGVLVNAGSTACLDVPGSSKTAGTQVDVWTCNGGFNQQWDLDRTTGHLSVYGTDAICLDAQGGNLTAGTAAVIDPCSTAPSQVWTIDAKKGTVKSSNGLCLGTVGNGTAAGTKLELQSCSGAITQTWQAKAFSTTPQPPTRGHHYGQH